jgi:hypothetical protein
MKDQKPDTAEVAAQSPYALFGTDQNMEKKGIVLDYGGFSIRIARAGGSNKSFAKALELKLKPYRRAMQTDTMDEAVADKLMKEAYAEQVVLGWASTAYGEGKIPGKDGQAVAFTKEACIQLFSDLPDLYADIREQAQRAVLFKSEETELDAKN